MTERLTDRLLRAYNQKNDVAFKDGLLEVEWAERNNKELAEECERLRAEVERLKEVCRPIVAAIVKVGDDTNWHGLDETDRVYPWYEIKPLADVLEELDAKVTL